MQALCKLDVAHLHWWNRSSFLSLPVQRLISSGKTFADTPTNNILSTIWASLILVDLAQNISHHNLVLPHFFFFFKWTTICLCFCWEILVQVWAWISLYFFFKFKIFLSIFFFVKIIYCRIFRKYRWGKSHSGNHY